MEISLDALKLGKPGRITSVCTQEVLRRRLAEIGFVPGTQVCCRYRTPNGSVTAVEFRGAVIALRTRDMGRIWVMPE